MNLITLACRHSSWRATTFYLCNTLLFLTLSLPLQPVLLFCLYVFRCVIPPGLDDTFLEHISLCVSPPWGFRAVFPSLISILLDLFAFPFAFPFFGFCTFYIPAESVVQFLFHIHTCNMACSCNQSGVGTGLTHSGLCGAVLVWLRCIC